ncbi:hypothetical protein SKAU_G00000620 [Synaphobranchus kaupii]|uniref:Uncharacterized protein n=1 Tax=Synaphobranchus kaupii TaxID=118154 RepID=A0A9Q1G998_SYNKA|nr:hypothetical protein SKAU_G00000620 [Synaphobranchus kaupii]
MMMNEVMKEQETELLTSWQCHLRRIIHLEYVENLDLVITASLDCNVRVWTVSGSYIGTFGQVRWRVEDPSTFPMELPADLKRLGVVQTKELDKEEPCSNSCKPHGFCNSWGSCNSCTSSGSCSRQLTRNSKFLPCSPLLPVPVVSMPDTLKKQQKSQEHSDALSKQKHRKKPCPPKQQPKDNGHA